MRICINNEEIDELSVLCHAKRAQAIGKEVVIKLKENMLQVVVLFVYQNYT